MQHHDSWSVKASTKYTKLTHPARGNCTSDRECCKEEPRMIIYKDNQLCTLSLQVLPREK